jgi:hypothetical protein
MGYINTENDVNVIGKSLDRRGHDVGRLLLNTVRQDFKYLIKLKLPETFSCQ